MKAYVNPARPFERLIGDNRGIVRQILGRVHCCAPLKEALLKSRPKRMRSMPVALRRGWVLCVLETRDEYRKTYFDVMGGRL